MSAAEQTIGGREAARQRTKPIGDRILDFLSSVRFGVSLLCILVVLSMIGMLIIQQNVQGFDSYFASLSPAESLLVRQQDCYIRPNAYQAYLPLRTRSRVETPETR